MSSPKPTPPRDSRDLNQDEQLALKTFTAKFMLKHRGCKQRQITRAAEKHFNIKITSSEAAKSE